MEPTAPWTLDELTRRVADALSVDYHGQASGRVRDLPDQRAIRWYTTLGLVDRPAAMRGRTALYGPRHLRQLVAIKRLQARGLTLAAVQAELAGASDADLDQLARIPSTPAPAPMAADVPARTGDTGDGAAAAKATGTTRRFWAAPPATLAPPPSPAPGRAAPPAPGGAAPPAPVPSPVTGETAPPATPAPAAAGPEAAPAWPRRPSPASPPWRAPGPGRAPAAAAAHLQGIHLGDEATLLIGAWRLVDDDDVRALRAAARPLLEALHARGLAGPGHEPGPGAPDHGRELP